MRKSGKWMVLLDERILELLNEDENEYMAPSDIASLNGIPYSSNHVARRCRKLAEHGLIQSVGRGVYKITDNGRAYLREEYNAAETNDVETENGNGSAGVSDEA